jgi:porphobilinogen synthase
VARVAGLTLRRMRQSAALRDLVREVDVPHSKLIQPIFVVQGLQRRETVPGLAGVFRETTSSLAAQVEADLAAGVDKFLLFGVPSAKREHDFDHSFTASQVRALRQHFGADIWLAADVCLCSYTTHGHCGILDDSRSHVDNGATVDALARAAAEYAEAGADCVAPSDMMDGRVAAIRATLDARGLEGTVIMSYAAKFDSALYGPFRAAADSAPARDLPLDGRASYQLDPARPADAFLSAARDDSEGADILMVKPGLPYLDVLQELAARIPKPWAVYQTSGEQAALELLASEKLADAGRAQLETWTAFRRAGADMIISYAARRGRDILHA